MVTFASRLMLVAVAFGLQIAAASADSPPRLNVSPSCDAAARGAIVMGRDKAACLGDERTAQEQLIQDWSKYPSADKTQCVGMATTGGSASYVELLSCLEIMRDSKQIRESDPLVGAAAVSQPAMVRPGRHR